MSPAPLHSPTQGTPAAPPVPQDCQSGVLGFFHTIERLKVSCLGYQFAHLSIACKTDSVSLSQTNKRTGWVNQGIDKPESIADHMYR
jgi:putative hydrolase of HD superfamily